MAENDQKPSELMSNDEFKFFTEEKLDRKDVVSAIVVEEEMRLKEREKELKDELEKVSNDLRSVNDDHQRELSAFLKKKAKVEYNKIKANLKKVGIPECKLSLTLTDSKTKTSVEVKRVLTSHEFSTNLEGKVTLDYTKKIIDLADKRKELTDEKAKITEEIATIRGHLNNMPDYERALNAKLTKEILATSGKGKQMFDSIKGSITGQRLIGK